VQVQVIQRRVTTRLPAAPDGVVVEEEEEAVGVGSVEVDRVDRLVHVVAVRRHRHGLARLPRAQLSVVIAAELVSR